LVITACPAESTASLHAQLLELQGEVHARTASLAQAQQEQERLRRALLDAEIDMQVG
jgi:hypothetical protein